MLHLARHLPLPGRNLTSYRPGSSLRCAPCTAPAGFWTEDSGSRSSSGRSGFRPAPASGQGNTYNSFRSPLNTFCSRATDSRYHASAPPPFRQTFLICSAPLCRLLYKGNYIQTGAELQAEETVLRQDCPLKLC